MDIDVAEVLSEALNRRVSDDEIVGMNATFGLRIVLFPISDDYQWPSGDDDVSNVEEMWQVRYRFLFPNMKNKGLIPRNT